MSTQKLSTKDNKKIWPFVSKQTVLNFATSAKDIPWCASCFYAFDEENKYLIFKTDNQSRHMQEALKQGFVAGTVLPDKLKTGIVKGIQFQGKMIVEDKKSLKQAKKVYYRKFPYAKVMAGDIAVIKLTLVKLTDNKLGFGKRLIWER